MPNDISSSRLELHAFAACQVPRSLRQWLCCRRLLWRSGAFPPAAALALAAADAARCLPGSSIRGRPLRRRRGIFRTGVNAQRGIMPQRGWCVACRPARQRVSGIPSDACREPAVRPVWRALCEVSNSGLLSGQTALQAVGLCGNLCAGRPHMPARPCGPRRSRRRRTRTCRRRGSRITPPCRRRCRPPHPRCSTSPSQVRLSGGTMTTFHAKCLQAATLAQQLNFNQDTFNPPGHIQPCVHPRSHSHVSVEFHAEGLEPCAPMLQSRCGRMRRWKQPGRRASRC